MAHRHSRSKWFACIFMPLITLVLSGALARSSYGEFITLESGNSIVEFFTEADDGGTLGLYSWKVDDVDHMTQQWFWYRVGSGGPELPIDGSGPLSHISSTSLDVDGVAGDDFLLVNYADLDPNTPESYKIQLRFLLTGGSLGSNRSDTMEAIRVENTGSQDLEFHLFQYANFDLNATANNDSVVITGNPENTARQSDPLFEVSETVEISETVVTPPPSHWELGVADTLLDSLNDGSPTIWSDVSGPLFNIDAAWSFQWDFDGTSVIPPGGVALLSKDKNIRPGIPIVPEPSSFGLAGLGILAMVFFGWRKRAAV